MKIRHAFPLLALLATPCWAQMGGGIYNSSSGASVNGAVTGGTAGSVLFVNPANTLSQDNNNFYFQDSPTTPTALAVNTNAALNINTGGDQSGTDALNIYAQGDAYLPQSAIGANTTDGAIPGWTTSSSRGTGAAPVILNTGDAIGTFSSWGYTGASPSYQALAGIFSVARGATASNLGGEFQIWTKADGGALTQAVTVSNAQAVTIASSSAAALVVGQNGATNPGFTVNAATASSVTGISVNSWSVGNSARLQVTSSGAVEDMMIDGKSTGKLALNGSNGGDVIIGRNGGSANQTLRGSIGVGSNVTAATAFNILAPSSTGTGALGTIPLRAFVSKQTTGSTAPTATTLLTIGSIQASHPGTNGALLDAPSVTWNDENTAGSGTATNAVMYAFQQPTLSARNTSVVTTNASTVYIANAPVAGTNQTLTNAYALNVAAGATFIGGTFLAPNLATSSAPTTGTLCWTTGTGNVNVDTTLACLSSTMKIKENIIDLDAGLKEVMKLRPVSYALKPEFNPQHLGRQVGLVAEEVQKVDDRLVGMDNDGNVKGVRYMQMTALLVKAIQEQQAEIDHLKAKRGE